MRNGFLVLMVFAASCVSSEKRGRGPDTTIPVDPGRPPALVDEAPTTTLSIEPLLIIDTEQAFLRWDARGVKECLLNDSKVDMSGELKLDTSSMTAYTLNCKTSDGESMAKTQTFKVAKITKFESRDPQISSDEKTLLSWSSSDFKNCEVSASDGQVISKEATAELQVGPGKYSLVCYLPSRMVSKESVVNIKNLDDEKPVEIKTFALDSLGLSSLDVEPKLKFSWEAAYAKSCSLSTVPNILLIQNSSVPLTGVKGKAEFPVRTDFINEKKLEAYLTCNGKTEASKKLMIPVSVVSSVTVGGKELGTSLENIVQIPSSVKSTVHGQEINSLSINVRGRDLAECKVKERNGLSHSVKYAEHEPEYYFIDLNLYVAGVYTVQCKAINEKIFKYYFAYSESGLALSILKEKFTFKRLIPFDFESRKVPDSIKTVYLDGEKIYLGSEFGGAVSTDEGKNWQRFGHKKGEGNNQILSITAQNSNIFFATPSGVYVSQDSGKKWRLMNSPWQTDRRFSPSKLKYMDNYLYAFDGELYRTNDFGVNWQPCGSGTDFAVGKDTVYTRDNWDTHRFNKADCTKIASDRLEDVTQIEADGTYAFLYAKDFSSSSEKRTAAYSSDSGTNWNPLQLDVRRGDNFSPRFSEQSIFANFKGLKRLDLTASASEFVDEIPEQESSQGSGPFDINSKRIAYVGNGFEVFDRGSEKRLSVSKPDVSRDVFDTMARRENQLALISNSLVRSSQDGGKSWTDVVPMISISASESINSNLEPLAKFRVDSRAYIAKNSLISSINGRLIRSDDWGRTWRSLTKEIQYYNVVLDDKIYRAPKEKTPIYISSDLGQSWSAFASSDPSFKDIQSKLWNSLERDQVDFLGHQISFERDDFSITKNKSLAMIIELQELVNTSGSAYQFYPYKDGFYVLSSAGVYEFSPKAK